MARLINADNVENQIQKLIVQTRTDPNDRIERLKESSFKLCLDIVSEASTIDPKSLFLTIGEMAYDLDKLYTEIQAVTGLTPERLLELFKEGYILQAPDYRKNFEEMQRMAYMDWGLDGNGGQKR